MTPLPQPLLATLIKQNIELRAQVGCLWELVTALMLKHPSFEGMDEERLKAFVSDRLRTLKKDALVSLENIDPALADFLAAEDSSSES